MSNQNTDASLHEKFSRWCLLAYSAVVVIGLLWEVLR
jgi:hypothetical protein